MVRISGVDLPAQKRIDIALTYLYGIGRNNVRKVMDQVQIRSAKRVKDLTEEEVNKIQKTVEKLYKVEGDLREEVANDIKRLKEIGSYRGVRHIKKLPVHGQRTRSNARTKRGKRVTIGALKKEDRIKVDTTKTAGDKTTATTK